MEGLSWGDALGLEVWEGLGVAVTACAVPVAASAGVGVGARAVRVARMVLEAPLGALGVLPREGEEAGVVEGRGEGVGTWPVAVGAAALREASMEKVGVARAVWVAHAVAVGRAFEGEAVPLGDSEAAVVREGVGVPLRALPLGSKLQLGKALSEALALPLPSPGEEEADLPAEALPLRLAVDKGVWVAPPIVLGVAVPPDEDREGL